ncbi:MAG: HupE/UreJ family protein [Alsobacter sp.]
MKSRLPVALAALFLATPAWAHTGLEPHVHGFAAGFAHPLGGADHLLAMVAVGLWAGLVGGRAAWAWPLAFVVMMTGAAAAGVAGVALPLTEIGIALSVVVLGAAIALGLRAPVGVGAALCAVFAVFHGHAHGAEMPADAAGLAYGAGFIVATTLLHAAGVALAFGLARLAPRLAVRTAGAAVAAGGVALLVG